MPYLQADFLSLLFVFDSTSEIMYEVLDESLRRAEMNHNITYGKLHLKYCFSYWCSCLKSFKFQPLNENLSLLPAILYECVKCIYTIHPKSELLEKAAKCIGNFVLSPKINLKYLGKKEIPFFLPNKDFRYSV